MNCQDESGLTPMHRSAAQGLVEGARLLLSHGADVTLPCNNGSPSTDLASEGVLAVIREMEKPAVISDNTEDEMRMLEAAKTGDIDTLKGIGNNSNCNCQDLQGRHSTPIHFASGYNRVDVVELLLSLGANVHAKDKGGLVPLHNACSYGHLEVVELLIKHGANVNISDLWKFTPLHEAAAKGKYDICKLLLKHGAEPTKKNRDGKTALDLVREEDEDISDLLRGDEALLEAARKGELPRILKLINTTNVNCRDVNGRNSSPIHLAAGYNQLEVTELLLEHGADVNAQDKGGLIPLHNAASYGHVEIAALMIKFSADINAMDRWGYTPLHEAAQKGRTQLCSLLILHGADPMLQNQNGETPLELASAADVRSLLMDAMPPSLLPVSGLSPISPPPHIGGMLPLHPGLGENFIEPVSSMENITIDVFLEKISMPHVLELFQKEDVTLDLLLEMSHDNLKTMGISTYGQRHRILKGIRDYKVATAKGPVPGDNPFQGQSTNSDYPDLVDLTVTDKDYISVCVEMQGSVKEHADKGSAGGVFRSYKINSIQRIINSRIWSSYSYRRSEIAAANGCPNERMLFHGSPFINAIVWKGFDERHAYIGGMFGAGIYFAEHSSKSNQYVYGIGGGTGCTLHRDKSCYVCHRQMLVCRVALGKPFIQLSAVKMAHAPPGHHSVIGKPSSGGLNFPEYVVYRGEQAYPEFLVTYQIVK